MTEFKADFKDFRKEVREDIGKLTALIRDGYTEKEDFNKLEKRVCSNEDEIRQLREKLIKYGVYVGIAASLLSIVVPRLFDYFLP